MSSQSNSFATNAYVVGEIIITLAVIAFAAALLLDGNGTLVDTTIATSLSTAVTVFWFSRRASEQSSNAVTTLANGKLSALMSSLENARSDSSANQQMLSDKMDSLIGAVADKNETIAKAIKQP